MAMQATTVVRESNWRIIQIDTDDSQLQGWDVVKGAWADVMCGKSHAMELLATKWNREGKTLNAEQQQTHSIKTQAHRVERLAAGDQI